MAASSQVSENKRVRDSSWNGDLPLPDAKRSDNGIRLVHDSGLIALLEKVDNMDDINSKVEETHTMIELQNESLPGIMKSFEDEDGLKRQTDDGDEEGSSEMGSIKQGEITDGNSEATSVSDPADMHSEGSLTYYEDVRAELAFFVDNTAIELEIINNFFDGHSVPNMYLDAVYGDTETVYGSLWEDDIWQ